MSWLTPLEAEALRHSIGLYTENRALVRELYTLRQREPWRVPTHELYLILRAGQVLPIEAFTALLRDYREAIEAEDDNRVADLHVWAVAPNLYSSIISVVTNFPRPPDHYKAMIPTETRVVHVVVEVHACDEYGLPLALKDIRSEE